MVNGYTYSHVASIEKVFTKKTSVEKAQSPNICGTISLNHIVQNSRVSNAFMHS